MSKNMLPMKSGGGLLTKLITIIVGLAVAMLVVKYPSDAAGFVTSTWHLLSNIVTGLVAFFRHLGA
jgi:hypothetical protein